MTTPAKILNLVFNVGELDRSLAFYEALGFKERGRTPGEEGRVTVFLSLPTESGPRILLIHQPGVAQYDPGDGYDRLTLEVDNLEGILQRLASLGLRPDGPVFGTEPPDERLACQLRDPDGYRVLLIAAHRESRLLNLAYRVGNLERSLSFYKALGFAENGWQQSEKDGDRVLLGLPTEALPRLHLIRRPGVSRYILGNGYDHMELEVEGLKELLASHDFGPHEEPFRTKDGPLACPLRDPDGYWVLLVEAARELGADAAIEALAREEEERRRKARTAPTNRVLPKRNDVGRSGVEKLWEEPLFGKYPRLRHDGKSTLRVRVPPEKKIGLWLRRGRTREPKLVKTEPMHWTMPYEWRESMIAQLADHYGGVLVFRDKAEVPVEICAPSCVKARSSVSSCECKCGGIHHGTGSLPAGFHVISETLAVKVSPYEEVAIALVRPRNGGERRRLGLV